MKKLLLHLFIFCAGFQQSAFAQSVQVELTRVAGQHVSAMSSGENEFEYRGYPLLTLISIITEVPQEFFSIKGEAENFYVNLRVETDRKLEQDILLSVFFMALEDQLGIEAQIIKKMRRVNVAYSGNPAKLTKCKASAPGVVSKSEQINRTWKAECVETSALVDRLEDWYQINIINEINHAGKFNFIVHHDEWHVLLENLKHDYGISIVNELREVNTLQITFN